jgi:hypothetical protein
MLVRRLEQTRPPLAIFREAAEAILGRGRQYPRASSVRPSGPPPQRAATAPVAIGLICRPEDVNLLLRDGPGAELLTSADNASRATTRH